MVDGKLVPICTNAKNQPDWVSIIQSVDKCGELDSFFIQLVFWDTPPKFDMEPEHECFPTEIAGGEPGEPCEIWGGYSNLKSLF